MIPEFHQNALIYAEHVVRYLFASRFVRGKKVLDLGSGVGYGSDMLKASGAEEVVAVDQSTEAIAYGRQHHASFQPDYLLADVECLPFRDRRFDVVVCLETIEHVADYRRLLAEVKRVMRPGGLLVLSTPNKGVYLEGNPFHTKEFTHPELQRNLSAHFKHAQVFAQDNWIMSAILPPSTMERMDKPIGGSANVFKTVGRPAGKALYIVALCSDSPLPRVSSQLAMTDVAEMHRYAEEIGRLRADVHSLSRDVSERDAALAEKDAALAEKGKSLAERDRALEEKEAALARKGVALEKVEAELANRESLLAQRDESLSRVTQELMSIRDSLGYRILEGYRRRIRWLFPPGSWRGLPYRALRRAVRMLLNLRRNPASLIRRALKVRRRYGTKALVSKSLTHLVSNRTEMLDPVAYALNVDWRNPPPPQSILTQPLNIDSPTVNWVVPTVGEGGGHLDIFRFVRFLAEQGYRQRIYEMPIGRPARSSPTELVAVIRDLYKLDFPEVYLEFEEMEPADITVATSWHTAYPVVKFGETRKKCYLVQDLEPLFTPRGTESIVAENTYRFGFHGITAGPWLASKLRHDFGMECDYFHLAVDHHTYFPKDVPERNRIFFYARPATPRRGFELGIKALEIFHARNPSFHIVFAGGESNWDNLPFPWTNVGYIRFDELNELYNRCAAALVISLTNCSLLPMEIMATGCPVVTTIGANNERVLPESTAVFAVPSAHELAQALEDTVRNPPPREDLVQKAVQFSWEGEAARVEGVLKRLLLDKAGR